MRRSREQYFVARTGLAAAYGAAFLLVQTGRPWTAAAVGAGLVTAATGLGRTSGASAIVAAVMAAVGGAAAYGFIRYVLGPAYPAVLQFAGSPVAPLCITLAFGLVARLDFRRRPVA